MPEGGWLLYVELCLYFQIFPYMEEIEDVGVVLSDIAVLVLELEEDYVAAVGGEEGFEDGCQCFEVYFDLLLVFLVGRANLETIDSEKSGWEVTEIPLGADVGFWSYKYFEIVFLGELQEEFEIFVACVKIEDSFGELVMVPHDVDADGVESHGFDHLEVVFPVLYWHSAVLNLS